MFFNIRQWAILLICAVFSYASWTAVIIKTKGQKALVDLEGMTVSKGDKLDALNVYGKPLGLLEIRKVKRGKAIAVLLKGKMGVSWILEPASVEESPPVPSYPKTPSDTSVAEDSEDTEDGDGHESDVSSDTKILSPAGKHKGGMGVIVGPTVNIVSLSSSKKITGMGWKGAFVLDFSLIEYLSTRINLGYQLLSVSGRDCNITPCQLVLHYPGIGLLLRGVFTQSSLRPWLGGGGSFFWPIIDKQNDLGLSRKSTQGLHGAATVAGGLDFYLHGLYIILQADFNWINPMLISFTPLREGAREFKPFYVGIKAGVSFPF